MLWAKGYSLQPTAGILPGDVLGRAPNPAPDVDGGLGDKGEIVGPLGPLENLVNHDHLGLMMIGMIRGDIISVMHVL